MWSDNETAQDLLGYQVHADLLKTIIQKDEMLPISIGIFGNWGSGKSSLMLLLYNEIQKLNEQNERTEENLRNNGFDFSNYILQIKFNSWQFENYSSTKFIMIETILEQVKKDILLHKDCFERIEDLCSRINFLEAGILVSKKFYNNLVPESIRKWLPTAKELEKITQNEEYNKLLEDISKGNSSKFIEQFRNLFENIIEQIGYKSIIVYIDDLDRCEPKKIIECLEAVKLFVNVKRTAFIIGADERIIEYAIKLQYPIDLPKEEISSPFSDYLEKLIQLPYKLPKLSDNEQETYITLLLCKNKFDINDFNKIHKNYLAFRQNDKHSQYDLNIIKKENPDINFEDIEQYLTIVPLMKEFLNGNPRQLKRFLNTVWVRLELAKVAGFNNIHPDILVKLMLLEYNTLYYSRFEKLYTLQRSNNGILPIEEAEQEINKHQNVTNEFWKDWDSDYLKRWISSKPSLADVNLQDYFWIARDALKNETPIASKITSKIRIAFDTLCKMQTMTSMKKKLPEIIAPLSEEDKNLLILQMNDQFRKDPDNKTIWMILNCDEENLLIQDNLDRFKQLFENIDTSKISPHAQNFFIRTGKINPAFQSYIASMPLHKTLLKAIKLKENK